MTVGKTNGEKLRSVVPRCSLGKIGTDVVLLTVAQVFLGRSGTWVKVAEETKCVEGSRKVIGKRTSKHWSAVRQLDQDRRQRKGIKCWRECLNKQC